jgi:hypothetical protein
MWEPSNSNELVNIETCASNQSAINVLAFHKPSYIARLDGASIEDACALCSVVSMEGANSLSECVADLLSLVWCCGLTTADGPHGLVGNDKV